MQTLNLAMASTLEKVLEKVLSLDANATEKLTPLNNKRVALILSDWQLKFIFHIEQAQIHVETNTEEPVNVTLTGSSFAFFNMALNERGNDAVFKGDVHFEGDVQTAQKFQQFWKELDLDWEEELSKYTGDIVAHQMGQFTRSATQHASTLIKTVQQNFSEYVKEEARVTPDPIEVESFYDQLDNLNSGVDRLSARIQRIQTKIQ